MSLKRSALEELFAYFKHGRASKIIERRRQFAGFVKAVKCFIISGFI